MDLQSIIKKAWQDDAFKRDLLANPREVLERELGVMLPENVLVFVHEQTPTEIHLLLPMKPEEQGLENQGN